MKIPRSNIKYKYYFTATMRKEKYHDMDNEKIFGKVLYKLNMKEAIEQKLITDYTLVGTIYEKQFE